jgi:glycine cleavage system H protein
MIDIKGSKFPLDRKYYKKHDCHVWLKVDGDKVKIGMDAFLTENAGFLNFISIDEEPIKQGEGIGTYESAKFVSKIYSPISGDIITINDEIVDNPRKINDDPYNNWIIAVKAKDLEKELRSDDILESEQEISDYMTQEFERLDVYEE